MKFRSWPLTQFHGVAAIVAVAQGQLVTDALDPVDRSEKGELGRALLLYQIQLPHFTDGHTEDSERESNFPKVTQDVNQLLVQEEVNQNRLSEMVSRLLLKKL